MKIMTTMMIMIKIMQTMMKMIMLMLNNSKRTTVFVYCSLPPPEQGGCSTHFYFPHVTCPILLSKPSIDTFPSFIIGRTLINRGLHVACRVAKGYFRAGSLCQHRPYREGTMARCEQRAGKGDVFQCVWDECRFFWPSMRWSG